MLLPYYSIGSNVQKIETCLNREFLYKYSPTFLLKTSQKSPVILSNNPDKIVNGIWGYPVKNGKAIVWHRSEGIIKKNHLRQLVRANRCLVPANGFFIKFNQLVYFMFSPKIPVLTFGGIWQVINSVLHFSILTVPMIAKFDILALRMPLLISTGSQRRFLDTNKPLMDITRLFKFETKTELNGFPVDAGLFDLQKVNKNNFRPIGPKIIQTQRFPEKEIKGNYYLYIQ